MPASHKYSSMVSTATDFIQSTSFSPLSDSSHRDKLSTLCASSYTHSFGHDYFVSTRPPLQQTLDLEGFLQHLDRMNPKLLSAQNDITDMIVDEVRMKIVLRVSYHLQPRGALETVVNDLLWILQMNESGDKVVSGIEFLDADAMKRLAELMNPST